MKSMAAVLVVVCACAGNESPAPAPMCNLDADCGGDVALEAALALAERPNTTVTLCHRGESFERAKPDNQQRLVETSSIEVLRRSEVDEIAHPRARAASPPTASSS